MSRSHPTKSETPKAVTNGVSSEKSLSHQRTSPMSNFITPAIFDFHGNTVRIIDRDGEPWFVAKDVCGALQIKNNRDALGALDDDEKDVGLTDTRGGQQKVAIVSESGMYTLVLRCRDAIKPGTIPYQFRKWVTVEVLPSIRKTGSYQVGQQQELSIAPVSRQLPQHIDLELAYSLASEAAAHASKAVFNAIIDRGENWHQEKFLLAMTYDRETNLKTQPFVRALNDQQFVSSVKEMTNESSEVWARETDSSITELISALAKRLQRRAEYRDSAKPKLEPELRRALS